MEQSTVEKILNLTKSGYHHISHDFSNTRNVLWKDVLIFKDYIKKGDKILDLGCGNGRLVQLFEDKKVDYLGVDYNDEFIKIAQDKYPQYDFQVSDVQHLNLPAESLDCAMVVAVLNHLPGDDLKEQVLKKVHSFLKPGGYLLMTNWNLWNWKGKKSVKGFWQDQLLMNAPDFEKKYGVRKDELGYRDVITIWQTGDDTKKAQLYYYAFTFGELNRLLEKNGFEVVQSVKTARNLVHVAKKC